MYDGGLCEQSLEYLERLRDGLEGACDANCSLLSDAYFCHEGGHARNADGMHMAILTTLANASDISHWTEAN